MSPLNVTSRRRSASHRLLAALCSAAVGPAWIRLSGELDLTTARRLTQSVDDAFATARLVGIDLRQLTFMDSTGLRSLVEAHLRARAGERRLMLIRGPRRVDRLLEIGGLSDRLEITDLHAPATAGLPNAASSCTDPPAQAPFSSRPTLPAAELASSTAGLMTAF